MNQKRHACIAVNEKWKDQLRIKRIIFVVFCYETVVISIIITA